MKWIFLLFPVFIVSPILGQGNFDDFSFSADSTAGRNNFRYHINNDCYDLSIKKELFILIPITGLFIADLLVEPRVINVDDLSEININKVPWFERNIIYFDTVTATRAAEMSDLFNKTALIIGVSSLITGYKEPKEILVNFVLYAEGTLITSGLTDVLKKSVGRIRPYAYNTDFPDSYRLHGAVTSSFPSGHTSSTSFNCFFAAKMIDDYLINDENRLLKSINWTVAAIIPAWVGYMRMEAGVHFLTDVLGGYAIGATCGYFIPVMHKIKNENLSFYPIYYNNIAGLSCRIKF